MGGEEGGGSGVDQVVTMLCELSGLPIHQSCLCLEVVNS